MTAMVSKLSLQLSLLVYNSFSFHTLAASFVCIQLKDTALQFVAYGYAVMLRVLLLECVHPFMHSERQRSAAVSVQFLTALI
jgi:hypothetical protein